MSEIKLEPSVVSKLQEYVGAKIRERGFEDETLHERLLLLTEEVGELVKACRKISGMNVDQNREIKSKTGEEVVDVINMVFAVAIELGLNVEEEYYAKEKIVDARNYGRSQVKG